MSQNIYDDEEFFNSYGTLFRSLAGLAGAPEWPLISKMLPSNLSGLNILDLGCGYGWFCQYAIERGVKSITGVDISSRMLEKAKKTTDQRINYKIQDIETISLDVEEYDLIYSSLALHYIKDFDSLLRKIHRALKSHGEFIFSIEHPVTNCSKNLNYITLENGVRTWPVDGYHIEGERLNEWFGKRVLRYHRMMSTYINLLISNGFKLEHIEEFCQGEKIKGEADATVRDDNKRPMFLIFKARK